MITVSENDEHFFLGWDIYAVLLRERDLSGDSRTKLNREKYRQISRRDAVILACLALVRDDK
jgi:hypothetical protein